MHREQPNHVANARALTPAFYGSYDWHSSVHTHWTLARVARLHPSCSSARPARDALQATLTAEAIAGEVRYLDAHPSFERPYGLAWVLTLAQELSEWDDPDAKRWAATLGPLTDLAATRLAAYVSMLTHPVRSGEHSQTAFALGLAIDWARSIGAVDRERALVARAKAFHLGDHDAPLHREPSGTDFLSPSLAEADLVRRVLDSNEYARWLDTFLPAALELGPVTSPNRRDGRLAHLDGLNLSRAWMLEGIASGLPTRDPRRGVLSAMAAAHRAEGLTALESDEDALTHWIGSFAAYLVTGRGLR